MKQFGTHLRTFARLWIPFCEDQIPPRSPFDYDVTLVANCLAIEQQQTIEDAAAAGKLPQHARFKHLRAAIGAVFKLLHGKDLASEMNIQRLGISASRAAPNLAKYDDTWPVALIFTYLAVLAASGVTFETMTLSILRRWTVMLLRLKTAARAADCAAIRRGFMPTSLAGLLGCQAVNSIRAVRFYKNKTIRFKSRIFSKWFLIGDHLQPSDSEPWALGYCVRTAVETYFERTHGLPRSDDSFFISLTRSGGKYKGVGSDVLRNDSTKCMRAAGVPERFLSHSVRSASLMAQGGSEDEILRRCDISSVVFRRHYDNPVSVTDEMARLMIDNRRAAEEVSGQFAVTFVAGGRNARADELSRSSTVSSSSPEPADMECD